jgi:hypothetical protein
MIVLFRFVGLFVMRNCMCVADQWSPIYTEGKKQYDRDFLLQFQAECLGKPIGLPNIPDITLMSVSYFEVCNKCA